jgi:ankyrin repeat protein
MRINLELSVLAIIIPIISSIVGMGQIPERPEKELCIIKKDRAYLDVLLRGAITRNDVNCVNRVLKAGASPSGDLPGRPGSAPILIAAYGKKPEIMKALFTAGLDRKSQEAVDAFGAASYLGHIDLVRTMLDFGIDPNVRITKGGDTALMGAAYHANQEVVLLLIERGADCKATNDAGVNALMVAADNSQIVLYLLESGGEIDSRDSDGETAVHFAVKNLQIEKLGTLLKRGADPNITDRNGNTPLKLAHQLPDSEDKERLLRRLKNRTDL